MYSDGEMSWRVWSGAPGSVAGEPRAIPTESPRIAMPMHGRPAPRPDSGSSWMFDRALYSWLRVQVICLQSEVSAELTPWSGAPD